MAVGLLTFSSSNLDSIWVVSEDPHHSQALLVTAVAGYPRQSLLTSNPSF
jgi:hypothetical protein